MRVSPRVLLVWAQHASTAPPRIRNFVINPCHGPSKLIIAIMPRGFDVFSKHYPQRKRVLTTRTSPTRWLALSASLRPRSTSYTQLQMAPMTLQARSNSVAQIAAAKAPAKGAAPAKAASGDIIGVDPLLVRARACQLLAAPCLLARPRALAGAAQNHHDFPFNCQRPPGSSCARPRAVSAARHARSRRFGGSSAARNAICTLFRAQLPGLTPIPSPAAGRGVAHLPGRACAVQPGEVRVQPVHQRQARERHRQQGAPRAPRSPKCSAPAP